jgi:hypothetical protein
MGMSPVIRAKPTETHTFGDTDKLTIKYTKATPQKKGANVENSKVTVTTWLRHDYDMVITRLLLDY